MTDLWNAIVTAAGGVSTEAVLPGADAPFAVVAAKTIESQQYELGARRARGQSCVHNVMEMIN